MTTNIIFGLIIFFLAYGFLLYLIQWSRRTIDAIANHKPGSLREILEELDNGN